MKAILFLSSLFFLLGLKMSSLIDLPGKASAVDQLISTKIIRSKPLKALPLFKDSEEKRTSRDDKAGNESSVPEEGKQTEPE